MKWYQHPPGWIRTLFPGLIWTIPGDGKRVYLSFDDGPCPETTPVILDILDQRNIKASFFCLGKQVDKYPALFDAIVKRGHIVGNHGYYHLDGWKTQSKEYIENVERADQIVNSVLFRPPFGRIRPKQIRSLALKYKIVMWDILFRDYAQQHTTHGREFSLVRPDSIIVMHDQKQSAQGMAERLKRFLEFSSQGGYQIFSLECLTN